MPAIRRNSRSPGRQHQPGPAQLQRQPDLQAVSPWVTLYLTLNRGAAPGNTGQSGAFSPEDLNSKEFHEYATMYEGGAKFSLIQDKLYTTIAVYKEDRTTQPPPAAPTSSRSTAWNGI